MAFCSILSLCSGGGGLDRAAGLALGGARVVCHVEREAFAAQVLAHAMEAGGMAPAPVWSDLRTFDGRPWRGVVDWVVAGIPCQGNSLAGKRLLADDERDLWADTARILRELFPAGGGSGGLILENVYGLMVPDRKGGREAPVRRVLRELAEMGWDAEWCVLPASAVGAAHKRDRVFVVAHGAVGRLRELRGGGDDVVYAEHGRRVGQCDTGGRSGVGVLAARASILPLFAPGPGLGGAGVVDDIIDLLARDPGKAWLRFEAERRNTLRWAEALAVAPGVEPAIRGLAHGVAGARRDWLRLLGNGVVDLQGAAAIRLCLDALEGDHG